MSMYHQVHSNITPKNTHAMQAYLSEIMLPSGMRCSYQSKFCNNHRAVKPNGDFHKLCEFHRQRANLNQKRMQQRRRLMKKQASLSSLSSCSSDTSTSQSSNDCDLNWLMDEDIDVEMLLKPMTDSSSPSFSEEDLEVLELILFNQDVNMDDLIQCD